MVDHAINNDENTCIFKVTPTLKSLCGWAYFYAALKEAKPA